MEAIVIELSRFIRHYLVSSLNDIGVTTRSFASAQEALDTIMAGSRPSLVCTSLVTSDLSGLELRAALSGDARFHAIPMVLVTSSAEEGTATEAIKAGFLAVFHKNDLTRFGSWAAGFLSSSPDIDVIRGRILHIEDSRSAVELVAKLFSKHPVEIDSCPSVESALMKVAQQAYDLILADYSLEGERTGLDFVRILRDELHSRTPVIMLSASNDRDRICSILESGANDFVSKPVIPRELLARAGILLENKYLIDRLEKQKHLLFDMAMRDQLTSLFNRRSLFEVGPKEIFRARRHGYPLSLLILDLDHFKEVNDRHGHQRGDEVLRQVGDLLHSILRNGDWAARFGGEEFVILMPDCSMDNAARRADHIRRAFEELKPSGLLVTVSIGVATCKEGWDFERLFRAADEAVYRAKANGRNRVERCENTDAGLSGGEARTAALRVSSR
ncbi:MAG: diguanylate cyclase [Spirochaetota bacterium]